MSNTNMCDTDKMRNEYIFAFKELYRIMNGISQITQHLYEAAVEKRWEAFCDLTNERESKLADFQGHFDRFVQMFQGYVVSENEEASRIKAEIRQQLKKVTKVNSEVIDIINSSKDELIEKIGKSKRGLAFLKNYGNQVNYEKTISKTY